MSSDEDDQVDTVSTVNSTDSTWEDDSDMAMTINGGEGTSFKHKSKKSGDKNTSWNSKNSHKTDNGNGRTMSKEVIALMESAGAIANTSSSRKRNIAKVRNIGKVRESPRKRRRTADPDEEINSDKEFESLLMDYENQYNQNKRQKEEEKKEPATTKRSNLFATVIGKQNLERFREQHNMSIHETWQWRCIQPACNYRMIIQGKHATPPVYQIYKFGQHNNHNIENNEKKSSVGKDENVSKSKTKEPAIKSSRESTEKTEKKLPAQSIVQKTAPEKLEKPIENAAKTNAENQQQQNYIKKDINGNGKADIVNNPVMDKAFEAVTELMMQRKRSASRSSMGSKSVSSIKFSNSPKSSNSNSNNQKTPTPNRAIEKQKGKIGNDTIGIGTNHIFPRTSIYDGPSTSSAELFTPNTSTTIQSPNSCATVTHSIQSTTPKPNSVKLDRPNTNTRPETALRDEPLPSIPKFSKNPQFTLDGDTMNRNLALIDVVARSGRDEYPKEWQFKLKDILPQLKQLAQECGLILAQKGEAKVVFSSKEPEQQGQLLTFTDNLDNSDLYVRVSEFGDWHLATQKHWPKASVDLFLYAVRGKCMSFFFEIPNESMSVSSAGTTLPNDEMQKRIDAALHIEIKREVIEETPNTELATTSMIEKHIQRQVDSHPMMTNANLA